MITLGILRISKIPVFLLLFFLSSFIVLGIDEPRDFFFEVSELNVTGHTPVIIRGHNTDVDIASGDEDIWEVGGNLIYLEDAEAINFTSTSFTDNSSNGTGARTLEVKGLDRDFKEITEVINLNGTIVARTTKAFIRVHQIKVLTAGSTTWNAGNIVGISNSSGLALKLLSIKTI